MFQSATLKLTVWYMVILMSISILFSFAMYQINFHELNVRLENLQRGLISVLDTQQLSTDEYRLIELRQASTQMILALFYVNVLIFIGGSVGSYYLARRTLQPIEKSHDAMSRFTSDASHELRTPLAAMKTELEVALRDPDLPAEEMRELLHSSLEEADKLIKLSEVFLKLARLDYDAVEFAPVVISDVVTELLKRYNEHDRIKMSLSKKATVQGNEPALTELFTILIENALKYSPPDSDLAIKVSERRMTMLFSITNHGPAIPLEQQERLFERFYRGDASRTASAANGFGLGLAIARRITDVHHGTIRVKSTDSGTTFTVAIPSLRSFRQKSMNNTTM